MLVHAHIQSVRRLEKLPSILQNRIRTEIIFGILMISPAMLRIYYHRLLLLVYSNSRLLRICVYKQWQCHTTSVAYRMASGKLPPWSPNKADLMLQFTFERQYTVFGLFHFSRSLDSGQYWKGWGVIFPSSCRRHQFGQVYSMNEILFMQPDN